MQAGLVALENPYFEYRKIIYTYCECTIALLSCQTAL